MKRALVHNREAGRAHAPCQAVVAGQGSARQRRVLLAGSRRADARMQALPAHTTFTLQQGVQVIDFGSVTALLARGERASVRLTGAERDAWLLIGQGATLGTIIARLAPQHSQGQPQDLPGAVHEADIRALINTLLKRKIIKACAM